MLLVMQRPDGKNSLVCELLQGDTSTSQLEATHLGIHCIQ